MLLREIPVQTLETELEALRALPSPIGNFQRTLRVEGAAQTIEWLLGKAPAPSIVIGKST